jgi:hypothetical protein
VGCILPPFRGYGLAVLLDHAAEISHRHDSFPHGFAQCVVKANAASGDVMNKLSIRRALLVLVLACAVLGIGCGSSPEGKYRDPSGTINAEFKDGKAYIALGAYAVDGTYKIEGDKIIASGDFGMMLPHTVVFTINKDGTIDGPRDTMIPRLEKVK